MIESAMTMPPPMYRGEATAIVSYVSGERLREWCGIGKAGCYVYSLGIVFMPSDCSPTRRPVAIRETVNVERLVYNDFSWCGSLKAHEFGHVNGWRH